MINNSEGPIMNPGATSLLRELRELRKDVNALKASSNALKASNNALKASNNALKASNNALKASSNALKASSFLMRYRVMETSFRDGRIPNAPEPLWHLVRAGDSNDPFSVFDHSAIIASQTPTRYYGYFKHIYGVHIDRFAAITAYPQLIELLDHRANLTFQPWQDLSLSDGAKGLLNDIDHFLWHFSQAGAHVLTTVDGLTIGGLLRRTQTQLQPRPPPQHP